MELLVAELLAQARRIWKYRWLGLAAAWVLGLVGLAASFALPDQFQAQARIYVDTQSILKPLMSGLAVQPNVDEQVKMLSRTLISRPNIEKLVRMADLDLKKQTKAEQEALIDSLMRKLTIGTTGRDNLYTLGYQDSDPEAARRVVQSLVSIFVESSLGASRKDTATATTFINEQIKTYEAKLEEAEQRLKEFRLRNLDSVQGDGKDATARIAEMHAQLERAKLELREAENARDAARAQLDAERKQTADASSVSLLPEAAGAFATPELDSRLSELRRNLDALLQRYTDAHPDVVSVRKRVRELEEQKQREVAELRKAAAATGAPVGNESGVHQELRRMMATAEVQVAALKARVSEYQSRYAAAMSQMKTAPQIEAALSRAPEHNAAMAARIDELMNTSIGVLSLCEHADSLLMWPHYGDGHRGFVIAFDTSAPFFHQATPPAHVNASAEEAAQFAEEFGRLLALQVGADNSPAGAVQAVKSVLERKGITTTGLDMRNCSGLTEDSKLTARTLLRITDLPLSWADQRTLLGF